MEDQVPLGGGWSLWRDVAVRSAGFPVSGLEVFGPGDEAQRLRAVAADPRFREAVTWQNRPALDNAVDKVAAASPTRPSRARMREEIVASYWQRYCAKNDTIGFFGPLAWGRIADAGPPLAVRAGDGLVRRRDVHLEAWGVQALAATLDPALCLPTGPRAEDDLAGALAVHPDPDVRARGTAALTRLVAAREAVARATAASLRAALDDLDAVFVEITGHEPSRNHGRAYGARTLAYVDCLRDAEVTVGPGLVEDVAPAVRVLLAACRWYCGAIADVGRAVIERLLPAGSAPFAPLLREAVAALMALPPQIDDVVHAFHDRLTAVIADPDPATIVARADAAFADHPPAWPISVFHSFDLQLAADGDTLLPVVGDVHPGANPLAQGVFAHRHPDPERFLALMSASVGPSICFLLPPFAPGLGQDARGFPVTPVDAVHIAVMPTTRARPPRRTWSPEELHVRDGRVRDASGKVDLSVFDALAFAVFIAGVRSFELLPAAAHNARVMAGRTVLQRESWSVPATEVPDRAADVAAFARGLGMPRRLFAKSPVERKPMYLDTESEVLARILCRHARRAREEPGAAVIRFTEMLPGPGEAWLADPDGGHDVSELRFVAVDEERQRANAP